MSEFGTLLGKLEHSDDWGFGDALELILDYTTLIGQIYSPDQNKWIKNYKYIKDIWTLLENAIKADKVFVKSGDVSIICEGPGNVNNPNLLVIDKSSFLDWYRLNKKKDNSVPIRC